MKNNLNKNLFKELLPYIVGLVIFIVIAVVYCKPMLEGKVINQPDVKNWEGMAHETMTYEEETGEYTYWTNSLFSGMPNYQISVRTPANMFLYHLGNLLRLYFPSVIGIILGYFIGFFILLRAFGVNKWLSVVGSIAISFSSYFFVILAAGHVTKAEAIGYLAPVIGGFFLIFRKKYFPGVSLVMIFTALGFMKHPQMSYYVFLMIGLFAIAEIFIHIKEKRFKDLGIAFLLFILAFGIGLGTRYGVTKANSQYLTETMRGGHSELTNSDNPDLEKNTTGLSLEYATAWSYGIDETMTLLIPNFKGGSSDYKLGEKSNVYQAMIKNRVPPQTAKSILSSLPTYWGDQPFTSGPVYVGAIICFLFVLGLFIVKGPYKWALLGATVFSILLSWGHNFIGFTKLFFNYFPMYDKFRAVSSILVVAEIAIPILAFLAIKTIMDKQITKEKVIKKIYYSAGITAGICLIFALFGNFFFDFSSANDARVFSQMPQWFGDAIIADRISMFKTDAFRSFVFIALAATLLWLYVRDKVKIGAFIAVLGILIVVDMVPVNKRYFGDDSFVTKREDKNYFAKLPYEEQILKDNDTHFRVLNLTTNTFNDARTSYYLKSIGGYHGAKLRRYQDLINEHISKNNFNVLNMLNAKYIIMNNANGQAVPQYNVEAYGNAWFVDSLIVVNTPDEESDALNYINLKTTAVTDVKFEQFVNNKVTSHDDNASIKLTSYAPNKLEYVSNNSIDKTAVFSEIYYPYGWKVYVDDQPVDHFRVNYVLRALNIPAGEHNIRFEFKPDAIYKGDKISIAFIVCMFAVIIFGIVYPIYKNKKVEKSVN
ncbi:YfhO family protein [Bacteroidales bacterium OttesenSCG-928-L14]|nr:YfhO family protein [Bacteroidales bacterium OttesenSCG-928-L14]